MSEQEYFKNHRLVYIGDIMDIPLEEFVVFLREFPEVLARAYVYVQALRDMGDDRPGRELLPAINFQDSGVEDGGGVEMHNTDGVSN